MNIRTLDPKLEQQLNDQMQAGYDLETAQERAKVWNELWQFIKSVMSEQGIESLEDLEAAFDGMQSINNWAMDFDMELNNAALDDPSFNNIRIEFCEEYITHSRDKFDHNTIEMWRSAAESYFAIGNYEEGERQFSSMLYIHPTYVWGWIGWSDMYGLWAKKEIQNYEKATNLLLKALEVKDLDSRPDVLERLADVYQKRGMTAEESETRQLMKEELKTNNPHPSFNMRAPVTSSKVGRNDPCTCGSGKKYKKCCG